MTRKWLTLAVAMTAVCLTATGLSFADEDSPLHKIMEQVNKSNNAIRKTIRTKVAYSKDSKNLAKHADDLIRLGKEAREIKEPSEKQKKAFSDWQKLSDDFIKKTEEFKTAVNGSATFDQAKKAYAPVTASCAACHKDFRVDEE